MIRKTKATIKKERTHFLKKIKYLWMKKTISLWFEAVDFFQSSHFPSVFRIAAVFITIGVLGFKGIDAVENITIAIIQPKPATKHVSELVKNVKSKDIVAVSSINSTMIAANNPYAKIKSCNGSPIQLTVGNIDYTIGTNDGQTEQYISFKTSKLRFRLNSEQTKLMVIAYDIGRKIGYPETVQALLLQETLAGRFGNRIGDTNLRVGKRSYGVMQMKVGTARIVLKKYPNLKQDYFPKRKLSKIQDEEIILHLIQDDTFAIKLAAMNFSMERKRSDKWSRAVAAYNLGPGGARKLRNPKQFKYTQGIIKHIILKVRPFNISMGLVGERVRQLKLPRVKPKINKSIL